VAKDIPDVYLRFEGIKGECNDTQHPGKMDNPPAGVKDGWITVSRLGFGFGWGGADKPGPGTGAKGAAAPAPAAAPAKPAAGGAGAKQEGTFKPVDFSLTKNPDIASNFLLKSFYDKTPISKVEVEICRYGGTGQAIQDVKIPFLRLIFENVHLTSYQIELGDDSLPSEVITFNYEVARMESIWTDNETGDRRASQPNRAGWDFKNHCDKITASN